MGSWRVSGGCTRVAATTDGGGLIGVLIDLPCNFEKLRAAHTPGQPLDQPTPVSLSPCALSRSTVHPEHNRGGDAAPTPFGPSLIIFAAGTPLLRTVPLIGRGYRNLIKLCSEVVVTCRMWVIKIG